MPITVKAQDLFLQYLCIEMMLVRAIQTVCKCKRGLVLLVMAVSLCASAVTKIDSLKMELAAIDNPSDSLPLLFDIYDLSSFTNRGKSLEKLYRTALRAKNKSVAFEALSLMASFYEDNDSMQSLLLKEIERLPESDEQKGTRLYIKMRNAARLIRSMTEDELHDITLECLARYKDAKYLDVYERIEYLFYLCTYLRNSAEGDMLISYFQELEKIIDALPLHDLYIRALFYTQASDIYLNNGMYDRAVEANKKMLEVNKEFDRVHAAAGRKYRNYDGSTFRCYYNMLRCHDVIPAEDVDIYYNRILSLGDSSPRLRSNSWLQAQSKIYYLMAKKRYAEVIPLIKLQLDQDNPREDYRYFVEALIEASKAVGNKDDLMAGLKINNALLQERYENKMDASVKELQILYEVNELKSAKKALINEGILDDSMRQRNKVGFSVVGIAVVSLMLILVVGGYRKTKNLAAKLSLANARLIEERDVLKHAQDDLVKARDKAKAGERIKTDFVNNMNHEIRTPLAAIVEYSHLVSDFAEEDKRAYIRRFGDVLSLNTDLLTTLVNDVLDLPSIENAKLSVRVSPTSAQRICRLAIDVVRKHVDADVKLVFSSASDDDVTMLTDTNRVEQVLLNLLLNAAKFTKHGMVSLSYERSVNENSVSFIVTDTGIGIPKGKGSVIFERFEKLDPTTQGNGLGLYIARNVARLLKGDVVLDETYRKGARFIFTVPIA